MKYGIIYARQSSGDENTSESVELQIEKCQELALKEGVSIISVEKDLNTSGKTYPTGAEALANLDVSFQTWYKEQTGHKMYREGLGNVMKSLQKIDFILCYDITRLYRPINGSHLESYINQLLIQHQVKILTVNNGTLDVGTFSDSIVTALQNRINHEHIALCRKKSMAAMQKLRDSGIYCNGGKAFGIKYKGRFEFEIEPRKAKVVQYIFQQVSIYTPYHQIIRYINENFSDCFKKLCYESNLYHITSNPIYAGYMYNTQHELIENKQMKGKEIIPFALWKKVQDVMAEKRRNPPKAKYRWLPFSGLLYDGYTGTKLVVGCDKGKVFYFPNIKNLKNGVKTGGAVAFQLDKKNYCGLYEAITPILILAYRFKIDELCKQEKQHKQLEKLHVELQNMKDKEEKLRDMFLADLISYDELKHTLEKNKKRKTELTALIAEGATFKIFDRDKLLFLQWTSFQKLISNELSNEDYEIFLKQVIKKITVFEDHLNIETVYGTFDLNRYLITNKKHFPKWSVELKQADTSKTPSFDFKDTEVIVTYKYPSSYEGDIRVSLIAKFDKLTIQAIGEN